MKFLHLEDSEADAELVENLIGREWPEAAFQRVANRAQYVAALELSSFDLILSDHALPDFDGLAALELARTWRPGTPFIFLSGTIGEERAVEALKRGATDYVIKDRPHRLVPAIRQALAVVEQTERRRRTEEALRQNQERFRQITENVGDCIVLLDLNLRRIYHNPAYEHLIPGMAMSPGGELVEEIHPEDRERMRISFTATLGTGVGARVEFRLDPGDGQMRHLEAQTSVLRDSAGQINSLLLVARDVTPRRLAEERIREQASLLEAARDAICVTTMDRQITYWNSSAERFFGWTAPEVLGRNLCDLLFADDPDRFEEGASKLMARGEWMGDIRPRTKRGGVVVVESRWTLVRGNSGEPRSILLIATDVTERRKLETEILRTQRMESIGVLSGGIAHDLNNVLSPIMMASELLRQHVTDESDLRLLANIDASAQHGAALVRQLLAFARGTDGQRTVVDVAATVANLQKLVRQTLPRSVKLVIKPAEAPWPIEADSTQLNQVLINLCINARDAMPDGGRIEISTQNVVVGEDLIRLRPGARPGPHVLVTVSDTGTGIPPAIIDKIFDPFFTTKQAGKGTGLGLSTVAGIVRSHGGFLSVESTVGSGTTFSLFFPARLQAAESAPAEERPEPSAALRGHGETVLVIDDDASVCDTVQLVLEKNGYRVFTAAEAAAGVALFKKHSDTIAVVVADMAMPGVTAPALVAALRRLRADVKIVAISRLSDERLPERIADDGTSAEYLAKPLTTDMLLAALARLTRSDDGKGAEKQ